jgi:putative ABC transport system substrate-binding protein
MTDTIYFRKLLAELVRQQVALIVACNDTAALAPKTVTASIPIVFAIGGDPVQMGLVASMHRPGGNLTGVTGLNAPLLPKKLELLHELAPAATNIAALVNTANPNAETLSHALRAAASSLGLQLHILQAANDSDFDKVFATAVQRRYRRRSILISRNEEIAALALWHTVPTISQYRDFATAGGLMSYGGRREDLYRPAGIYAGWILRGEKPADLPVRIPSPLTHGGGRRRA